MNLPVGTAPTTTGTTRGTLAGCIFDVDGVLLASPHEQAWREALTGLADPTRFTNEIYQAQVAGRPRLDGALAALRAMGVENAEAHVGAYAAQKQRCLLELIDAGGVAPYPDAVRFAHAVTALGWPTAVASSSKNARAMLAAVPDGGRHLLDLFGADACGRDLRHGKPDPEIFVDAAGMLGLGPSVCLVVEDAPAGIRAAKAGGMAGLGIARFADAALLVAAGADLVVESLDEVDRDALAQGRLGRRPE